MTRLLPLALAAFVAAALVPAASAHSTLTRSSPQYGVVVAKAPRNVDLFFDNAVVPASGIRAIRNGGGSVIGAKAYSADAKRELVIPLRPGIRAGDYTVRWRAVSDDGHVLSGVIAFGVGAGRPPPRAALSAGSTNPPSTNVLSRWLFFVGLLISGGALAFRPLVWQRALAAVELEAGARAELERRALRRTAVLLAVGFYLTTLGASLAWLGTPSSSVTRFGRAFEVGIAAASGGAASALLIASSPRTTARLLRLTALAAIVLLLVPSLGGHALEPSPRLPNVLADLAHVGSAALWLGGLIQLALLVPLSAQVLEQPFRSRLYGELTRRFSTLALVAVVVLLGTGIFRSLFEFSSLSQLWSTGYGRTLLVKISLFVFLLGFGALNRLVAVPRILAGTGDALQTFSRLRRLMAAEIGLLLAVAAAVALLTDLRPGRSERHATPASAASTTTTPGR